jgi:hypothetical protein
MSESKGKPSLTARGRPWNTYVTFRFSERHSNRFSVYQVLSFVIMIVVVLQK